ncbi:1-aminocyclopropane-1-carboxylate deaminase [Winogradskyella epiphytica]|uniref:1-aminocyclopropane-1-carboxylate deaminase n=1 Tax=Winogradskyella epiphytica TaxID=262005 RepID=A0A2V4XDU7_9FLAO|nr:pyridoxal-phosphate dependent enzyme [Winogradskyella epiphytica]PYE80765.1 1-aminocyclopropane-1-carboxylate deaminase [Winogradskyella epiphytica]GGW68308.1 1-aminocyclopropane-1-carboxylate deaminase [Winogradskyella epiphytica]
MIVIKDQDPIYLEHQIDIKLDYLNHKYISGNKYRKLKYNLLEAKGLGFTKILTFGGAYSNHIAAVAAAGKEFGFDTIGIIRGEELVDKIESNSTLSFAKDQGMLFHFISRNVYREKTSATFLNDLKSRFGSFYLIPEGGTNSLAIKGCEEILRLEDSKYDYICCAVGTGGTISGLINSSQSHQHILGFPALKGDFLREDIRKFAHQENWSLITDYHFGGYGKIKPELIAFINQFKNRYHIPLDPIYTGKMMYGIFDLMDKGFFAEGSQILAIHTGGLQGISGVNKLLKRKNQPLIDI